MEKKAARKVTGHDLGICVSRIGCRVFSGGVYFREVGKRSANPGAEASLVFHGSRKWRRLIVD